MLLLRGSCKALKAPINVFVFCNRNSKQLQLSLSLLFLAYSYYIKPSQFINTCLFLKQINIHVLQSEQSVKATVHH